MFCEFIVYSLKAGEAALPLFPRLYILHLTLYTAAPLPAPYPLIRYSRCVVSGVDDATAGKLGLLDEVYHACIVLVGVDADIGALCRAPMEYSVEDASLLSVRGNALDSAVGAGVVQPLTVLDIRIGRIIAYDKNKGGAWVSVVLNDITHASLDVALNLLARGIPIAPLGRIAICSHLRTSVGENSL